jgi:hypothetical protein
MSGAQLENTLTALGRRYLEPQGVVGANVGGLLKRSEKRGRVFANPGVNGCRKIGISRYGSAAFQDVIAPKIAVVGSNR